MEVHRERQGTDQEAEQQGHFETVLGVDRAGGEEEQAEDDGAERHGAGEEDVPVGRAHSREVDSPDEADNQEVDQTQLEPAQSLDELTMSNFFSHLDIISQDYNNTFLLFEEMLISNIVLPKYLNRT